MLTYCAAQGRECAGACQGGRGAGASSEYRQGGRTRGIADASDAAIGVTTSAPDAVAVTGAAGGDAAETCGLAFIALDTTDPSGLSAASPPQGWMLRTCMFCSQFSLSVCGLWFFWELEEVYLRSLLQWKGWR